MIAYIAFNKVNSKYLGKSSLHKDSMTTWTEYPRFYPTIKGLKRAINESNLGNKFSASDVDIIELDGPFNIIATYPSDMV